VNSLRDAPPRAVADAQDRRFVTREADMSNTTLNTVAVVAGVRAGASVASAVAGMSRRIRRLSAPRAR
jgi:hypothetical protein